MAIVPFPPPPVHRNFSNLFASREEIKKAANYHSSKLGFLSKSRFDSVRAPFIEIRGEEERKKRKKEGKKKNGTNGIIELSVSRWRNSFRARSKH